MKDLLGHGSASGRTDFARNKIGFAPGARFTGRPTAKPGVKDQVAALRGRLGTPAPANTLFQKLKRALS